MLAKSFIVLIALPLLTNARSALARNTAAEICLPGFVAVKNGARAITNGESHQAEISSLKFRWAVSLETRNPDLVLENYSPSAILLPTLSPQIRNSRESMRAYFVEFLAKRPRAQFNPDSVVQLLGPNHATESGTYTFTFGNGQSAVARYTFIYERTPSGWRIVQHHSSLLPASPSAPLN